jgi:hypothetical protein
MLLYPVQLNHERQAIQMADTQQTGTSQAPASKRLLALYPDLGFSREVAKKVCETWAIPASTLGFLDGGQEQLVFFMETMMSHDSTREEFLWHYIEAMTGEQDVHQKEY